MQSRYNDWLSTVVMPLLNQKCSSGVSRWKHARIDPDVANLSGSAKLPVSKSFDPSGALMLSLTHHHVECIDEST
jgi:hypothetical protein